MKIALPAANGQLCAHFGHCEKFVIMDTDDVTKTILNTIEVVPPPHEPGVLPKWLHELGVDVILAGSMGMRAQQFFQQYGIKVVVGVVDGQPKALVLDWLKGTLMVDSNAGSHVCDH